MKKYIFVLLVAFSLTGCYTQLAVDENKTDNTYSQDQYEPERYGDEEVYVESDTIYENEEPAIVNNYYFDDNFGSYRRYFGHYYPSSTIIIGYNYSPAWYFHSGWSYFWWDPWYPTFCGFDYYPGIYSYWGPNYYYPYWAYNYNSYNYNSYDNGYRYRTDDLARLRNNDGQRSSYTNRDGLRGGRNRSVDLDNRKDRNPIDLGTRDRIPDDKRETRDGITDDKRKDLREDDTWNTSRDLKRKDINENQKRRDLDAKVRREAKENDRKPVVKDKKDIKVDDNKRKSPVVDTKRKETNDNEIKNKRNNSTNTERKKVITPKKETVKPEKRSIKRETPKNDNKSSGRSYSPPSRNSDNNSRSGGSSNSGRSSGGGNSRDDNSSRRR